jgi:hypothetical protein
LSAVPKCVGEWGQQKEHPVLFWKERTKGTQASVCQSVCLQTLLSYKPPSGRERLGDPSDMPDLGLELSVPTGSKTHVVEAKWSTNRGLGVLSLCSDPQAMGLAPCHGVWGH